MYWPNETGSYFHDRIMEGIQMNLNALYYVNKAPRKKPFPKWSSKYLSLSSWL